ncbi:MAG: Tetraacyldisaccharide 4'-kinase [Chlamydiae bacterium]|nr:Tetraacyldisaccharide 4'-kinase [Chlamydiota bacterium]
MTIENQVLEIIEGKKSAPLTKALLHVMSHCYRGGIALRHLAYDTVIPTTHLSVPVVSVGNIVAGGTGKTPVVEYLAKALSPLNVAILTRGYRRKGTQTTLVQATTPVEECGDEPYLLAQKLPGATILVDSNRSVAGFLAQSLGADIILLDDGMQHRKLHRDIEIGVLHADDLFGKGYYLPRGLLRDQPKRLAKADILLLNGVKDEDHFHTLETLIRPYSSAPLTALELLVSNSTQVASKKVAAFCAIAAPTRFYNTLKSLGCDIVHTAQKPDHIAFSEEELELLANRAVDAGAECLVCTEKDAVKLPRDFKHQLPLIPLEIALQPTFGKEHLETLIKKVKS